MNYAIACQSSFPDISVCNVFERRGVIGYLRARSGVQRRPKVDLGVNANTPMQPSNASHRLSVRGILSAPGGPGRSSALLHMRHFTSFFLSEVGEFIKVAASPAPGVGAQVGLSARAARVGLHFYAIGHAKNKNVRV